MPLDDQVLIVAYALKTTQDAMAAMVRVEKLADEWAKVAELKPLAHVLRTAMYGPEIAARYLEQGE